MSFIRSHIDLTQKGKDMLIETLHTPIRYEYDVCVAGGGVAGVSAALAAAREGKSVALLDRGFLLGGLATAGLVTIYLPLCDGMGHQVSFGIAEELLRLSVQNGHETHMPYPSMWLEDGSLEERRKCRYAVAYNAQLFAINAEQLLQREGVDILYGATVVAAPVTEGRITHLVIEGKSGREAISVKTVVDATGDCDVASLSGEDTAKNVAGNPLAAWYYSYGGGAYKLHCLGACDTADEDKGKGVTEQHLSDSRFSGLLTKELSDMMCHAHAVILSDVQKRRMNMLDMAPVTIPTIPQVRMTRRLVGVYTMDDTEMHKAFADSVGLFPDWRKRGPVYELPFSTLHGAKIQNLLCAGRCISVTDEMWDITRVIPVCAVSGEAAGVAAALFEDMQKADIRLLQAHLQQKGVKLHR